MASSSERVLAYKEARNESSSGVIGRSLSDKLGCWPRPSALVTCHLPLVTSSLSARREDALQRDAEIQHEIRHQVVVRQVAAGEGQRVRGHLR